MAVSKSEMEDSISETGDERVNYKSLTLLTLSEIWKDSTFLLNGLFYHNSLDQLNSRMSFSFIITGTIFFNRNSCIFNANSGDPDQMPCPVASDLVCTVYQLPFWGFSWLKWVKILSDCHCCVNYKYFLD